MDDQQIYIEYLQKKGSSKSSIAGYIHCCKKFIEWAESRHMEIEYVTYSELLDYVATLKGRVTQRTIQSYMIAITHYFEALVQAEIILQNPAKYLDLKTPTNRKLYAILSREQLENLYNNFDITATKKTRTTAKASAIRNKIAIGLMVFQGLDSTALSKLRVQDVDVLGGKITVNSSRSHAARNLALQAIQIIELDRYINQTRKELQHHFKKEDSELLLITGYKHFNESLRRLTKRLRKQEPQLQSLRHIRASVITHWLRQYNLREVQYMAGHRKILSTELYQQNDIEGLQADVDRFHPMNGQQD